MHFRNDWGIIRHCWSCHSRASWVCPEVCKTKRNPVAWMNSPPPCPGVERENWQSCPLIWRTRESGARNASAIFQSHIITEHLIIIAVKHTVCWLYQFCQEICKHTLLQLPTAVSHAAMISQFSVQGCASQVGASLCAWCTSLIGFPRALDILSRDNVKHAPARHGKEDLKSHAGSKSSPI